MSFAESVSVSHSPRPFEGSHDRHVALFSPMRERYSGNLLSTTASVEAHGFVFALSKLQFQPDIVLSNVYLRSH